MGDSQLIIEEMVRSGKMIAAEFHKYKRKSNGQQALASDSTTECLPPNNGRIQDIDDK